MTRRNLSGKNCVESSARKYLVVYMLFSSLWNASVCLSFETRAISNYRSSFSELSWANFDRSGRPCSLARFDWEGDDVRWASKFKRNVKRSVDFREQPVRNFLILTNVLLFLYQTLNTVDWIAKQFPSAWPNQAPSIVLDTLLGRSRAGPLTMDLIHSKLLSPRQPHRYLTAGFLHGSIWHLLLNMDSLRRLPRWLETGLSKSLYLTTLLISIVTGNIAHSFSVVDNSMCLGASGGICGLYGLLYVSLVRMGNHAAAWHIIKGMGFLLLAGFALPSVSNAGHVGGFLGGIAAAIICGPSYRKSYALRRKNSLSVDVYKRDYRTAMGYDKVPTERGFVPIWIVWMALASAAVLQPLYRSVPASIVHSLRFPGSLTSMLRFG